MLCVDFFGPVREDGTEDNTEVAWLLNGDIVGTLDPLSLLCRLLTGYLLRSPVKVLPDARGTTPIRPPANRCIESILSRMNSNQEDTTPPPQLPVGVSLLPQLFIHQPTTPIPISVTPTTVTTPPPPQNSIG